MRAIHAIFEFYFFCIVLNFGVGAQDEPLFLTPLIKDGKIAEARNLSRVGPLGNSINRESYSGFITVDEMTKSNIFFWFFPAISQESPATAPLLLSLDEVTIFSTLLNMHGPFKLNSSGQLVQREVGDWTRNQSVIYVETPVGTGYSFTGSETGYSHSSQEAGENTYKFLVQFFKLFPEYAPNPFHIAGIGYGSHFAAPLFERIHEKNINPSTPFGDRINLSGLFLFAPWIDPVNQVNYGGYLRNLGLIDEETKSHFDRENEAIKAFIGAGMFVEAKQRTTRLLHPPGSYLYNKTGFSSAVSVLDDRIDQSTYDFINFNVVDSPAIRRALHVGNLSFDVASPPANSALDADFMTSVKPNLVNILKYTYQGNRFNVTIVAGQMDLFALHLGVEDIISGLECAGKEEYEKAGNRGIWKVGEDVAGYVRKGDNLQYVLERNAGHLLILDRPQWNLDLIQKVSRNLPLL